MEGELEPVRLNGRVLLIGRRQGSDILIPHPDVSTSHAVLFTMNGRHYVRDLGSRTGTYVNGQLVRQSELKFEDIVRVGVTELRYEAATPEEASVDLAGSSVMEADVAGVDAAGTDDDLDELLGMVGAETGVASAPPAPAQRVMPVAAPVDEGPLEMDFSPVAPVEAEAETVEPVAEPAVEDELLGLELELAPIVPSPAVPVEDGAIPLEPEQATADGAEPVEIDPVLSARGGWRAAFEHDRADTEPGEESAKEVEAVEVAPEVQHAPGTAGEEGLEFAPELQPAETVEVNQEAGEGHVATEDTVDLKPEETQALAAEDAAVEVVAGEMSAPVELDVPSVVEPVAEEAMGLAGEEETRPRAEAEAELPKVEEHVGGADGVDELTVAEEAEALELAPLEMELGGESSKEVGAVEPEAEAVHAEAAEPEEVQGEAGHVVEEPLELELDLAPEGAVERPAEVASEEALVVGPEGEESSGAELESGVEVPAVEEPLSFDLSPELMAEEAGARTPEVADEVELDLAADVHGDEPARMDVSAVEAAENPAPAESEIVADAARPDEHGETPQQVALEIEGTQDVVAVEPPAEVVAQGTESLASAEADAGGDVVASAAEEEGSGGEVVDGSHLHSEVVADAPVEIAPDVAEAAPVELASVHVEEVAADVENALVQAEGEASETDVVAATEGEEAPFDFDVEEEAAIGSEQAAVTVAGGDAVDAGDEAEVWTPADFESMEETADESLAMEPVTVGGVEGADLHETVATAISPDPEEAMTAGDAAVAEAPVLEESRETVAVTPLPADGGLVAPVEIAPAVSVSSTIEAAEAPAGEEGDFFDSLDLAPEEMELAGEAPLDLGLSEDDVASPPISPDDTVGGVVDMGGAAIELEGDADEELDGGALELDADSPLVDASLTGTAEAVTEKAFGEEALDFDVEDLAAESVLTVAPAPEAEDGPRVVSDLEGVNFADLQFDQHDEQGRVEPIVLGSTGLEALDAMDLEELVESPQHLLGSKGRDVTGGVRETPPTPAAELVMPAFEMEEAAPAAEEAPAAQEVALRCR